MDSRPRSYRPDDLRAVFELARRAVARPDEQVGKPLWHSLDDAQSDTERFRRMHELAVVVEEESELVAFAGVQPDAFPNVLGPLVAPRARGRKLGSVVLETVIELARGADVPMLVAAVGRRNSAGKLLLERHGFRHREGLIAIYRLFPAEHRPLATTGVDLHLRTGGADDLDVVWSLYREGFPVGTRAPDVWERWLAAGEVFVGEAEATVIGFVHLQPGWLTHVGVTGDERGKGIGEALASAALAAHWQRHPGDVLHLTVEAENQAAIRLYRRLGFAPWLLLETFAREP